MVSLSTPQVSAGGMADAPDFGDTVSTHSVSVLRYWFAYTLEIAVSLPAPGKNSYDEAAHVNLPRIYYQAISAIPARNPRHPGIGILDEYCSLFDVSRISFVV